VSTGGRDRSKNPQKQFAGVARRTCSALSLTVVGAGSQDLAAALAEPHLAVGEDDLAAPEREDRPASKGEALEGAGVAAVRDVRCDAGLALDVDDHSVGVRADRYRALARMEPEGARGTERGELREPLRGQATAQQSECDEHREQRRETREPGPLLPHRCARLEDRHVVRADEVDVATRDRVPELLALGGVPEGRADLSDGRSLRSETLVVDREREIVRAGLDDHARAARTGGGRGADRGTGGRVHDVDGAALELA